MRARSPLSSSLLVASLFTLGVAAVLASACTPDGGSGRGEGEGEGAGGSSVLDVGCDADDACEQGAICDLPTRTCVAGFDCTQNASICALCGDPAVDCGFGAASAFCDADAGVCRRTKSACDACVDDAECGEGPTGLPSVCADGFCAPGCGACPDGFQCVAGGCVPRANVGSCAVAVSCSVDVDCPTGNKCSDFGICLSLCDRDDECAAGQVCALEGDVDNRTCRAACPLGQHRISGGVDEVCHADGRFGPPCATAGSSTGCPSGTECDAQGVCQRVGCQSDAECPARTFCNVGQATCVDGCNSDDDCGAFERCNAGTCVAQGCRSKNTSCNPGEFCCGAELYADQACPADVDDGACFLAREPFCLACASDDDCSSADAFGVTAHCFELQKQDAQGQTQSLGKFCSTGCRTNDDCPRGIPCHTDLPDGNGGTTSGCIDELCAPLSAARGP